MNRNNFSHFSSREIYNTIQSWKNKKASTHIPINIVKNSSNLLCQYLTDLINCMLMIALAGSAETTPVLKRVN